MITFANKIDLLYLSTSWIWLGGHVLSVSHYLQMQSLYYLIQLCIHRKYIVHHLITAAYFIWGSMYSAHFYLALGAAVFQGIIAILLLAKEYHSRILFILGMSLWFIGRIIVHLVLIATSWASWDLLEQGFNIYIWGYSTYTFVYLVKKVTRDQLSSTGSP